MGTTNEGINEWEGRGRDGRKEGNVTGVKRKEKNNGMGMRGVPFSIITHLMERENLAVPAAGNTRGDAGWNA